MLNLFKGNLILYAVFHLHDETPNAAYAQGLEIRLSNNECNQARKWIILQSSNTLHYQPIYFCPGNFWNTFAALSIETGWTEILSLRLPQKHSQEEQSTKHYLERQILNITHGRGSWYNYYYCSPVAYIIKKGNTTNYVCWGH